MKKVYRVLRNLFGSKTSNDSYRIWAKTEYGSDWQYAYEYMITHNGKAPPKTHLTNQNLEGWI